MYAPKGKGTFWFWTLGKHIWLCSQFSSVKCKLKIFCISEWYSTEKSFKIREQYATVVTQLKHEIGMGMGGSLLLMQKEVIAGLHELERS